MEVCRFEASQRIWIEPWFNVLGILFGKMLDALPSPMRRRTFTAICRRLGGHAPEENPQLASRLQDTVALAKQLQNRTGQWPAMVVLTSHAETMGPDQWLRFEMLRQGLQIAGAVQEARVGRTPFGGHPKCFVAIDPYALDTVSPAVGGFYSGWMRTIYLAWDRQPSTQSWLQRHWLLRRTGYDRVAWRMLRSLRANDPVLMVLSGGLPHNARLLYTAREFLHALRPPRWPFPKIEAEKKLMEILMKPADGVRPPERGNIPPSVRRHLDGLFGELGFTPKEREGLLNEFQKEFRLETPYRIRFFNLLVERLARRGKPLLLLPITHRASSPHVVVQDPRGLYVAPGDPSLQQLTLSQAAESVKLADFARSFAGLF